MCVQLEECLSIASVLFCSESVAPKACGDDEEFPISAKNSAKLNDNNNTNMCFLKPQLVKIEVALQQSEKESTMKAEKQIKARPGTQKESITQGEQTSCNVTVFCEGCVCSCRDVVDNTSTKLSLRIYHLFL